MNRSRVVRSLVSFAAFIAFALMPISAFAQHGGGGHGGGGGGGFHGGGGGGGFHGSGAAGGGFSRGSGAESRGGGFAGARAAREGSAYRGGGSEAGRNLSSSRNQSSNVHAAINDGQWHSFANSGASAHSNTGRSSGGVANSTLSARNAGSIEGGWRSFGSSRGAVGFGSRGFSGTPGFGWRGNSWRGGFGRGWGFGVGWPYWGFYWGPSWAYAWDPWWYGGPYWYGPYWYGGWQGYNNGYDAGYDDYSDVWSSNPPPYRPNASQGNAEDSHNNLQVYPARPDPDDDGFNVNYGSDSLDSAQSASPQPGNSNAPNATPRVQPGVVAPSVI